MTDEFRLDRFSPPQNFLGLPKKYSNYSNADIVIYPVAYEGTASYGLGTRFAPAAIIEASRFLEWYEIETNKELHLDFPIHTLAIYDVDNKVNPKKLTENIFNQSKNLLNDDKFIVGLGGEHSISLGLIKAHSEKYSNLSILQIDAHTDLRNEYEGTAYSHASTMRRAMEFAKTVHVGIRSISKEEKLFADGEKIDIFYAKDIYQDESFIDKVINCLSENVYVTIDVDGLAYSLVNATGTPEPGGLEWWTVLNLLKGVVKAKNVVGFDIVELAPDKNNTSSDVTCAKLCHKFLNYIFYQNRGVLLTEKD